MMTLWSIGGYAGSIWFIAAAVLAGVLTVVIAWFGREARRHSVVTLLRQWLLVWALFAGLIMLLSGALLQRNDGVFDWGSAAEAAAIMGLLTAIAFLLIAADQGILNLGGVVFLLVAGSAAGFVVWFAAFAIFPRLFALSGI